MCRPSFQSSAPTLLPDAASNGPRPEVHSAADCSFSAPCKSWQNVDRERPRAAAAAAGYPERRGPSAIAKGGPTASRGRLPPGVAPARPAVKARLCIDFFAGDCRYGISCRFTHSVDDIRSVKVASIPVQVTAAKAVRNIRLAEQANGVVQCAGGKAVSNRRAAEKSDIPVQVADAKAVIDGCGAQKAEALVQVAGASAMSNGCGSQKTDVPVQPAGAKGRCQRPGRRERGHIREAMQARVSQLEHQMMALKAQLEAAQSSGAWGAGVLGDAHLPVGSQASETVNHPRSSRTRRPFCTNTALGNDMPQGSPCDGADDVEPCCAEASDKRSEKHIATRCGQGLARRRKMPATTPGTSTLGSGSRHTAASAAHTSDEADEEPRVACEITIHHTFITLVESSRARNVRRSRSTPCRGCVDQP